MAINNTYLSNLIGRLQSDNTALSKAGQSGAANSGLFGRALDSELALARNLLDIELGNGRDDEEKGSDPLLQSTLDGAMELINLRAMEAAEAARNTSSSSFDFSGMGNSMPLGPAEQMRLMQALSHAWGDNAGALQETAAQTTENIASTVDSVTGKRDAVETDPSAPIAESNTPAQSLSGKLAALFESAGDAGAIGYDKLGGTSYGLFQLSSRMGVVDDFLTFLKTKAPHVARRLEGQGPANTGSTRGEMPDAWRALAKEIPDLFRTLQTDFVRGSHFEPALDRIRQTTGLDMSNLSGALKETLFSTSIQHGAHGAADIFANALGALQGSGLSLGDAPGGLGFESDLIQAVYGERGKRFTGSSESVREAALSRMGREQALALALLDQDNV